MVLNRRYKKKSVGGAKEVGGHARTLIKLLEQGNEGELQGRKRSRVL